MSETITMPAPPDVDLERAREALQRVADALKPVIDAIIEAITPVIRAVADIVTRLWDAIARAVVPPKWWHLYKHSKKARIRKKYRKRISEAVLAALAPAGGDTS